MNSPQIIHAGHDMPGRPFARSMNIRTTILASRWLIAATTSLCLLGGVAYALFTRPVYRSDLLIQVEPSASESRSPAGDVRPMQELKPDTTSEIQVLNSRMVVSRAVETLKLYIDAAPRYVPVIGWWLAARTDGLSQPITGT